MLTEKEHNGITAVQVLFYLGIIILAVFYANHLAGDTVI